MVIWRCGHVEMCRFGDVDMWKCVYVVMLRCVDV